MPRLKHDYTERKLQFFLSDIPEVTNFFKSINVSYNAHIRRHTVGRTKEKLEYKEKILQDALAENAKKQIEALEIPIDLLKKGKKNGIYGLINDLSKNAKLSVSDKVKAINALKVELGEPTTISKNENLNKEGNVINEADFIQD